MKLKEKCSYLFSLVFFSLIKSRFTHPKHHTTVMTTSNLNLLQFFSAEHAHGENIIFAHLTLGLQWTDSVKLRETEVCERNLRDGRV